MIIKTMMLVYHLSKYRWTDRELFLRRGLGCGIVEGAGYCDNNINADNPTSRRVPSSCMSLSNHTTLKILIFFRRNGIKDAVNVIRLNKLLFLQQTFCSVSMVKKSCQFYQTPKYLICFISGTLSWSRAALAASCSQSSL